MFELISMEKLPPWEWPKNADQILLSVLRDDHADESDRLLAAELAGELTVSTDELAGVLLSIVQSDEEPESLRARVAISLGPALEYTYVDGFEYSDEIAITENIYIRIKESLRKLYMDGAVPEELRRRVLEGSARAPQDWHKDAIRAAYASSDENWRMTAVFCMGYVSGFEEQILEALGSENPEIVYEAARAASNLELDAAWPRLASLVASEETDKDLLLVAIEAVANIRPREAGVILVDLIDSEDEDIAETAKEAMYLAEMQSEDEDIDDDQNDNFSE